MSEPFFGEIKMFAGNFAPRGWAFCDGQLLPINQNDALFSLLGTIYGGDGRTTFALPDLRGREAVHAGQGPGLSNVRIGQKGGGEAAATLSTATGNVGGGAGTTVVTGATSTGGGRSPYQGINYIIALVGIYPSRS